MTNKEASEWFKKRAQETTMPGAREAFKLAAEALNGLLVGGLREGTDRALQGGDGMNRLDQVIADITYVRSCLKLLKTIQESGDCNICKKKRTCEYVPKLGEQVRYNCPFFEREVTE